ncbi:hypothetical protein HJFPF1_11164 [Paramyrothecium foliicola]|nr:hypothetical protein HJFPF1_11164 [Paramyrothecium foliicola]
MFFAAAFVTTRLSQIFTLIPCMGMLAWFVHQNTELNVLTPMPILLLFIVSVLALAWAIFTLFSYHRSSANARFVALIDLGFVGAFIAAVYYLRGVASSDCTALVRDGDWRANVGDITIAGPGYDLRTDKPCAMLKASWAFAIMNCIFFAWTAFVAFNHGDRISAYDDRRAHHHHHRHSHRSRSGSRRSSHHSHRRVYV